MSKILVVDDEHAICWGLSQLGASLGHEVKTASSAEQGLDVAATWPADVLILDVRLPGIDGLAAMEQFRTNVGAAPIIVITAFGDLATAVRAVKHGAFEYVVKPFSLADIRAVIQRALRRDRPIAAVAQQTAEVDDMLGRSPVMQEVFKRIALAASSDASVLLQGESGVGKELAARTIHELSRRSDGPFVALNCGAMTAELIESELFGHEKGSFTGASRAHAGYFARAAGGTLFLDEITEMPTELQVKLLRVLETRRFFRVGGETEVEVDARLVTSTNRDPATAVQSKALREDLYYRIAQFPIRMPSLRERGEDVIELAREFLVEQISKSGVEKRFSDEVLELFRRHDWPGNVRELRNVVARAYILAGDEITIDDLPANIPSGHPSGGDHIRLTVGHSLDDVERRVIFATLEHFSGDKKKAARALGISLKTLYNRLKKYKLS